MSLADRLLVGGVVVFAGFVVRDHLAGPGGPGGGSSGRGTSGRGARGAPTAADSARAQREYAGLVAGVPPCAEPPAWLRAIHVGRLLAASRMERRGTGPDGAAVARAARGTYLAAMLREQDSTVMRWPLRAGALRVWVQAAPARIDPERQATGYVRAAFRVWNEAPTGLPFEMVADSTSADVHVTWAPSLGGPGGGADEAPPRPAEGAPVPVRVGHTIRFADGAGWVVAAHVVLAELGDLPAIQNAALHEAGHVLGLGHSPRPGDQMAAITDGRHFGLTDADRATAAALYTLAPGRVR